MESTANITDHKKTSAQSKKKIHESVSKLRSSEIKKEANLICDHSFDARNKTVNIAQLKSFAFQNFRKDSALRIVLLAERDVLTFSEFVAKMETWTNLLRVI